MMSLFPVNRYAFKVWYRDLVVWTKYWWTSLLGALGEPILYFLAMGYGLGTFVRDIDGIPYIKFLAPALIASSVMHSASFETTYSTYTRMEVQKTFNSIAVTPINVREVVAGEILWGATKSLLPGFVMFLTVVFLGYVDSWMALAYVPVLLITALLFSSLGMLMTSFAKDYDFFTYYFTLFLEPMFLFSGTFFPLYSLPPLVQKVAWLLPLAHPVTVGRCLFTGAASVQMVFLHSSFLLVMALVLFAWAVFRMEKRMVK